ncbi:hypothetical protein PuT2_14055 [Pusillimonas sp. T2]|nr:hypothetical protein PuT2_14055 [Pusillimonas sp. T2]
MAFEMKLAKTRHGFDNVSFIWPRFEGGETPSFQNTKNDAGLIYELHEFIMTTAWLKRAWWCLITTPTKRNSLSSTWSLSQANADPGES